MLEHVLTNRNCRQPLVGVCFAPKMDIADHERRPSAIACATAVEESAAARAIATADACLHPRTCDPITTRAEIRLASIDTNVSGSNPKRPMHEDVHSDT